MTEILLILAIALVILGPDRLPGVAKALGRAMREFRRASREIRSTLEVEEVRRTIRERVEDQLDAAKTGPKSGVKKTGAEVEDDLADKKQILHKATRAPRFTPPTPPPLAAGDVPAEGGEEVQNDTGAPGTASVAERRVGASPVTEEGAKSPRSGKAKKEADKPPGDGSA